MAKTTTNKQFRPARGIADGTKRHRKSKINAAAISQALHLPIAQLPSETKKSHPRAVIDLTGDDSDEAADSKRRRTYDTNATVSTAIPEAVVQAAATGNRQLLENLLDDFHGDLAEATAAAASNGRFGCVVSLRDNWCDPDDDEHRMSIEAQDAMRLAVGPAAWDGHADVVQFMLSAMVDIAMSTAIAAGHADVVAFLLAWEKCKSDSCTLFEEATNKGQGDVAERIYEVYPQIHKDGYLYVEMAGRGRIEAVKYMRDHGNIDAKVRGQALECATANNCIAVVAFLRDSA
ncbi:hypothetical protein PHYPSEUDO_008539 [Phytophthora pseudosyringae]|uniref:Ankyrin repeat protein n=1 Tax=Phytophthora pseudosyringae TaxID=221518 RepID=A0A8T1VEA5_9STRA|nr:hypothetical protein PHYPSEUDO_008539 [Phytophthora pseudosyringae]